ncbi:hypothetical protein BSLG_008595 [Batrachochytrium salamandrivorans]|nr:hypothetical protein BSLG_008595 [Batrachochytrium salamandrivorans]
MLRRPPTSIVLTQADINEFERATENTAASGQLGSEDSKNSTAAQQGHGKLTTNSSNSQAHKIDKQQLIQDRIGLSQQ